ncbi:MAG: SDR family oxidoreductase [Desulfobacteraceae bacterium]
MLKLHYSGKRALILGGSCDMGLALAEAMTASGLYPLLTYRDARGRVRIDERLRHLGRGYDTIHLELQGPQGNGRLKNLLDQGVAYLVDMAHGDLEGLVAAVDVAAADDYFRSQITARAALIQQVARAMLSRRQGRMVFISSTAAARPHPGQGFYAAAKQAAEALYRSLGLELAGRGVTTVTLRPGYVDAGRGRRYLEHKDPQALFKVPLGRALTPAEVAHAVMFLLCDEAVGFNATTLTMDGGLSAGK